MSIALSILSIYIFILFGFIAKKIFKDELQERGMSILSVYFLHPIFSFWGLSTKPITLSLLQVPLYYILISCMTIAIGSLFAFLFFSRMTRDTFFFKNRLNDILINQGLLHVDNWFFFCFMCFK